MYPAFEHASGSLQALATSCRPGYVFRHLPSLVHRKTTGPIWYEDHTIMDMEQERGCSVLCRAISAVLNGACITADTGRCRGWAA